MVRESSAIVVSDDDAVVVPISLVAEAFTAIVAPVAVVSSDTGMVMMLETRSFCVYVFVVLPHVALNVAAEIVPLPAFTEMVMLSATDTLVVGEIVIEGFETIVVPLPTLVTPELVTMYTPFAVSTVSEPYSFDPPVFVTSKLTPDTDLNPYV